MNPKRTNYRRRGTDPLWALGAPLVYNRSLRADSGRVSFFSMKKTLDWLMMVEGLPLGDCRFALCLTVTSSFLLRFSLFSIQCQSCMIYQNNIDIMIWLSVISKSGRLGFNEINKCPTSSRMTLLFHTHAWSARMQGAELHSEIAGACIHLA